MADGGMIDGSDAIADWPLLNALINTASGLLGFQYIMVVAGWAYPFMQDKICLDGSDDMQRRAKAVLTSDPGMGIIRHADAGYETAIENARKWNVDIPMLNDD